ncbi:hypothetical protein C0993_003693, partial [Termitomyces sp. T159_Od127]
MGLLGQGSPNQMSRLGFAPVMLSSPFPTTKRAATNDIALKNLSLQDWLKQFDIHPICGKLKMNYAQFAEPLLSNSLYELSDIVDLLVKKLLELGEGRLNFGIANCLINYAKENYMTGVK